jgi:transposase-like protein
MSKYSKAFKLKIIRQCLSGKSSPKRLATLHGIHYSNIQRWVNAYQAHGSKTLRRRYTHYSTAFKLNVLKEMRRRNLSLHQAALRFDIAAPSSIYIWQKLYNQGGTNALDPRPRGRPAMSDKLKPFKPTNKPPQEMTQAELIREVQYRRAETAYLKKLEAVLQAREATPEPKPK